MIINQLVDEYAMTLSKGQSFFGDWYILFEFSKRKKIIVEIGTSMGLSTMVLSIGGGKVYTIDKFTKKEFSSPVFFVPESETPEKLHTKVKDYLKMYNPNIETLRGDSIKVAETFQNNSIDLLFIDGDHTGTEVKKDYDTWFPKVCHGGDILFHDYSEVYPGVKHFVNRLIDTDKRIKVNDFDTNGFNTVIKILKKL